MKIKKYHTFKYLISRIQQYYYQFKNPQAPWLTPLSIRLLNQLIKETDIGFEFGSGRSTNWFAKRCNILYSIEHNSEWYEACLITNKDQKNIKQHLRSIDSDFPFESPYLKDIREINSESIDFVLNDGKIRGCVSLCAIPKLKSGGILIIDNAERYLVNNYHLPESIKFDFSKMSDEWKHFLSLTLDWRRIWTTDGISSTLIMFKP